MDKDGFIPRKYLALAKMSHLIIWFFRSITVIILRWNGVQRWIFALFVRIGIWN